MQRIAESKIEPDFVVVELCCNCGFQVGKFSASFKINGENYRICGLCFRPALLHFVNGTLTGYMAFRRWNFNRERQIKLYLAQLDRHFREIY